MGEPTIALTSNAGTPFQFRQKDVTVSAFFREMLEEQDWKVIPVPFSDGVLGMAQKWFKENPARSDDEEEEAASKKTLNDSERSFAAAAMNSGIICDLTAFANKYDFACLKKVMVITIADLVRGSSIDHLRSSFIRTKVPLDALIQGTEHEHKVEEARVPESSGSEHKSKKRRIC